MTEKNSALISAIGGVCGQVLAKFFVHPIDTIKAKIQVQKLSGKTKGSLIMNIF